MIKVSPSLFAADFLKIESELISLESAEADMLHIDIMDGHFVPNLSFGPDIVSQLRPVTNTFFDVHLMLSNPIDYVEQFAKAGANGITFHVESLSNPIQTIEKIKNAGCKVGISLKPGTSAIEIEPYINMVDMVLVMTIEPGFGGQSFIDMSEKIKSIKTYIETSKKIIEIQVDGGITPSTARLAVKAGANNLVSGSSFFKNSNYKHAVAALKNCNVY